MVYKKPSHTPKRGQSGSNAAVVVIITMVLIILYILFLPPENREDLLSGGNGQGTGSGTGTIVGSTSAKLGILMKETPGKIIHQSTDEKDFPLPSFTVSTETRGQVIKSKTSLYIKSSAFQDVTETMDFSVNPTLSENLVLSFNVIKGSGRLTIMLNGKNIYTGVIKSGNSPPIYLDNQELKADNTLTFIVEGPGVAFWRYNEYSISDIQIAGDVTDISGSEATQSLTLETSDLTNIDTLRLSYLAECNEAEVQEFQVYANTQRLFRGIPDCAVTNYLPIDVQTLKVGKNDFDFSISSGRVLVDRVKLQAKYDDPKYPTYYFEMHEDYFTQTKKDPDCGKADGICTAGCEPDEDVDCCFKRSDNYWCDIETDNLNDRCVSFVNDCDRCDSGYEDRSGDPPDKCVANNAIYCGDDTDGECPNGCSQYEDKDCCFEIPDAYWCEDVPLGGKENVCEQGIDDDECDDCAYGYENEEGDSPDCSSVPEYNEEDEETLDKRLVVKLKFTFPNEDQKRIEVYVNGMKLGINTARNTYEREIDTYVRSGTNSIEIRPENDVTITELRVTVEATSS